MKKEKKPACNAKTHALLWAAGEIFCDICGGNLMLQKYTCNECVHRKNGKLSADCYGCKRYHPDLFELKE